jgi:putative transposase
VRDTLGRDVVTERRACRVLGQARNAQRRKACIADDEPQLFKRIVWMASEYGRYGYRRITALLRAEGWWVNHKRVERIWRQEGLKVPAKKPKRRRLWLGDGSCIRLRPTHRNHAWSYDFVMDRTADGRAFRMLTIVDEFSRECLVIDLSRKMTSEDVLERLSDLFVRRGVADHLHSDNGSEFTAKRVRDWLERVGVKTLYTEPASPWENGCVESFNGKLRDELLAREVFDTLLEAKVLIERWRKTYNTLRPHSSLGHRPPAPESHRPCPPALATPQQADRGEPLAGQPS